jgi:hypothetical protein
MMTAIKEEEAVKAQEALEKKIVSKTVQFFQLFFNKLRLIVTF